MRLGRVLLGAAVDTVLGPGLGLRQRRELELLRERISSDYWLLAALRRPLNTPLVDIINVRPIIGYPGWEVNKKVRPNAESWTDQEGAKAPWPSLAEKRAIPGACQPCSGNRNAGAD